jgi:6-phosphogluconolactonase
MKNLLAALIIISISGCITGQNGKKSDYNLLISPYSGRGKSQYIAVYGFNARTGEAVFKSQLTGIINPSYMVVSPDGKFVYSVNETGDGTISSFAFNSSRGELTFVNKVSSGGNGPTYLTIDKEGKFVFCANYGSGGVGAIPVNKDGSLSSDVQVFTHQAKANGTGRQKGSHAHAAVMSPDNKYLMVPDLGTDKINIYRFDVTKASNPLEPANPPFVEVKSGSGPRHIDFHPNGKFAYVIHELEGIMTVYDYRDGTLKEKQIITLLAPGFTGRTGAADNHVSPDGRFLYGSNRGEADVIIIYKINKDGTLVNVGHQSTLGKHPRNFVIDPGGEFLLVGNNTTNDVSIFRINKKTGLLTPTGNKIEIAEPGCLKFVKN